MSDPRQTRKVIELPFGGGQGLDATRDPDVTERTSEEGEASDEFLWRGEETRRPAAVAATLPIASPKPAQPNETSTAVSDAPAPPPRHVKQRVSVVPPAEPSEKRPAELDRSFAVQPERRRPVAAVAVMGIGALLMGSALYGVLLIPGADPEAEVNETAELVTEPDPVLASAADNPVILGMVAADISPTYDKQSDRFFVDTRRPRLYRVHPLDHANEPMPTVASPAPPPIRKGPPVLAVLEPPLTAPAIDHLPPVPTATAAPTGTAPVNPLVGISQLTPWTRPDTRATTGTQMVALAGPGQPADEDTAPARPADGAERANTPAPQDLTNPVLEGTEAFASIPKTTPPPPITVPPRGPDVAAEGPVQHVTALATISGRGGVDVSDETALSELKTTAALTEPGPLAPLPNVAPAPEPPANSAAPEDDIATGSLDPNPGQDDVAPAPADGQFLVFAPANDASTTPEPQAPSIDATSLWITSAAKSGDDHVFTLFNGTRLIAENRGNAWRFSVAEPGGADAFQAGDRILLEYGSETKISKADALYDAFATLDENKIETAEFGIIRGGVLETVTIERAVQP